MLGSEIIFEDKSRNADIANLESRLRLISTDAGKQINFREEDDITEYIKTQLFANEDVDDFHIDHPDVALPGALTISEPVQVEGTPCLATVKFFVYEGKPYCVDVALKRLDVEASKLN